MNKFWLLLSMFSVSNLQAQTVNDTLQILDLLEKESRTWRSGDIAEHASCWQERSYNKVWINRGGGELLDIPAEVIIHPSKEMTGQGGQAYLSNFQFNIYGDKAWVNHDEVSVGVDGKETYTHEMRLLEKVNGEWKLVGQSLYPYPLTEQKTDTTSYLNIADITSKKVETVLIENRHFEAPNWHKDGYLLINSYGLLEKLDLKTKELSVLPTGNLSALNNDHGLSPDQSMLVLSNFDKRGSSWDTMESALYVMPVEGGKAKRLTKTEGLDDGPEYSPDGKYIYFNSYRTGHMQLWRMGVDGSTPEQLTFDLYSNWFPHISPDNQWMVYISYIEDQKQQHLFGKKVKLRLMNLQTREITDLTSVFYGGQGTINVASWSPDSKRIAFVSYSIGN